MHQRFIKFNIFRRCFQSLKVVGIISLAFYLSLLKECIQYCADIWKDYFKKSILFPVV